MRYLIIHLLFTAGGMGGELRKRRQSRLSGLSRFSRETIYESIRSAVTSGRRNVTSSSNINNNEHTHPYHKHLLEFFHTNSGRSSRAPSRQMAREHLEMKNSRPEMDVNYADVVLSEKEIKEAYGIP